MMIEEKAMGTRRPGSRRRGEVLEQEKDGLKNRSSKYALSSRIVWGGRSSQKTGSGLEEGQQFTGDVIK